MAKTKQSAEPKELDRTILVDGQPYNINAVEANHVKSALIIKNIGLTGSEKITERVEFTGDDRAEVSIVSAETGGRFNKEIRVPDNTATDVEKINKESVLNYNDTVKLVLNKIQKGAISYSWDKDNTELTPEIASEVVADSVDSTKTYAFNYISIVTGVDDSADSFAEWNYKQKYEVADDGSINIKTNGSPYVPVYLFIELRKKPKLKENGEQELDSSGAPIFIEDCITYFGTADSETPLLLAINSAASVEVANKANKAKQLETARKITADLSGGSNNNTFDGSEDKFIGITGELSENYLDNSVQDKLAQIKKIIDGIEVVGKAKQLNTARNIRTNLASTSAASFDGTANVTPGVTGVLGVTNGGTGNNFGGAAKLHIGNNFYEDGTYFQPKILIGVKSPDDSSNTVTKDAPNGAIYIKYSS